MRWSWWVGDMAVMWREDEREERGNCLTGRIGSDSESGSTCVGAAVANGEGGAGHVPGRGDYEGIKIYIIARR